MSKSVGIARRAGSKLWSFCNQSQLLTESLSQGTCHSHVGSTSVFPENPHLQNPRVFSHSSLNHRPDNISGLHLALEESSGNSDPLAHIFGSIDQPSAESSSKQRKEIDTEKLEEVLFLLQSSVDESLEPSLNALKLNLNEEFIFRVLETPLVPGGYLIRFFRWAMEKEFPITTPLLDLLVRAVCQNVHRNGAFALWDLIKEIGERENSLLNAEMLNDLVTSFSRLGEGEAVFEVFYKFEEFSCVPNSDTYYLTIEALCKRGMYSWASFATKKMLDSGVLPDSEKMGQIICLFCKGMRLKEAHSIYLYVKESNREPPQSTVKFLISALAHVNETVELALGLLDGFSTEASRRAIKQYDHVVQGLCRKKSVDKAKELVLRMVESGPPPGNTVFNFVIGGLSKAGDADDAVAMLRLMQRRGLRPDVYTYSVVMSGYAKGGQVDEACRFLREAKKDHLKLCPATFHTLIRGFCKIGNYDKALELLSEMRSYGVEPNVDEGKKLVQSLCLETMDWRRAEKLLEEMKDNGLFLPGSTRGLINAVKEIEYEALAYVKGNVEA